MDARGYPLLFGESGASLADADWIDHANKYLPANLSALKTTFVDGSRAQRSLRVSYEPGPSAFNFAQLSGGSIAEMLDQAATHCGSFVTSHPCPTLTMSVTFLRAGTAKPYVATGRLIKLTSVTAVLGADLTDDKGQLIATVSLVSQLVKDLSRLF
jgi:acyl-coenzyme A thioesterase PaaI-like protein